MEPITIGLIVSGIMLLMVVLGMRVAFAAGLAGMIGLIWIFWAKKNYGIDDFGWALTVATKTAGQVPHSKVTTQALSLIPTFILIGYLAYYAGLTQALFEAAKRWIAWVPGGLAVSTVFATAGFAAVSGASVATAAVFARIAIPEMLKIGYDKRFAAGVVAAGGTLASLIPPSAILVIYAIIVEQDVGKLLLAGFLPGIFSAIVYGLLIIGMAMVIKDFGPPVKGFTWRERFECLPAALPILFVVATIILFVYNPFGGDAWGTPTEGGAIGAFVVFCIALWRGMRWPQLKDALLETAKLSVMIFTIIWGVLIYVRFLGFADLPGAFSDWITGLEQSPMLTLVFILLAYAVLGMFMDAIGMLLLTLPLGALVVAFMRVVIGIPTFGTFMPVLIALAFRETQILWGITFFLLVVFVGLALRILLAHLRLLLVPRLASMLVIVVLVMLLMTLLSSALGVQQGLSIGLFPMVILTLTIERMSIVWDERGPVETLQETAGTLLVAIVGYYVMNSDNLVHLMYYFPELLLVVLAACLMLGTYNGYRLTELFRFRELAVAALTSKAHTNCSDANASDKDGH